MRNMLEKNGFMGFTCITGRNDWPIELEDGMNSFAFRVCCKILGGTGAGQQQESYQAPKLRHRTKSASKFKLKSQLAVQKGTESRKKDYQGLVSVYLVAICLLE